MADPVEAQLIFTEADHQKRRTVVPGIVTAVTREEDGERDADFFGGVPTLAAGQAAPATPSPDAPMLSLAGGGMYFLIPSLPGDEALGLVSDRAINQWRATRTPGQAPAFERTKDDSDVMLTPFAITAPEGAPSTWGGLVMGGPLGPSVELPPDGTITITKQGTTVATITMDAAGSITHAVDDGQSVNIGGAAAVALAKAQIVSALVSAFQDAITAALPIVPPAGDGGTAGFTALLAAFLASSAGGALETLKAKGE